MRTVFAAAITIALCAPALADKIEPAAVNLGRPVDFEQDVLPVLEDNCIACHNVAISESKLVLEDVPSVLKGGKRGPAVVPKEPDQSLLFLVAARAKEPHMPPLPNKASAKALTPRQLGILRQWIVEGATEGMGSTAATLQWQPIPSGLHAIYTVALSPWGRFVAAGRANQIDVYDILAGEQFPRLTDPQLSGVEANGQKLYPQGAAHRDFVQSLAFSPDGTLLASGSYREVKLWQRAENVQRQKITTEAPPIAATLSADGQWLAVALADNSIRLISTKDGQTAKTLAGHAAPVTGLQFTPDGTKLLSGSRDKTLRLWTVADGQPAGQLETPAEINDVLLNKDATQAVSAHQDNIIRVWAIPFGEPKPVVEMKGHSGPVTALDLVMPNGTQVFSGGQDGTVRVWELSNGGQAKQFNHGAPVISVAARADGQVFASAGGNSGKLWDANGKQLAEMKGDLTVSQKLVALTEENEISKSKVALADAAVKESEKNHKERDEAAKKAKEARDAAEKAMNEAKTKEKTALEAAAKSKEEAEKATDNQDLQKKKTEAEQAAAKETEAAKKATEAFESAVRAQEQADKALVSANEQLAAKKQAHEATVASQKKAEETLNAAKPEQQASEKPIRVIAFSLDGKKVATAGDDQRVHLWDGQNGKPLENLTGHTAIVQALFFGPNQTLISASDDKTVITWDANPGWRLVGRIGPPQDNPLDVSKSPFISRVLAVAFSHDGRLLATGGGDPSRSGELLIWNVEKRELVRKIEDAHSDTVFAVEFSRDDKQLLSGAADKFAKLFDVETGKLIRSFEGHTHHVLDVAWKADGSRIATAGADNAIKIWNVETGEQQRTISNYAKQVTSIQYIGVTDNLASGSGDKTVKFHRAGDGGNYRGFGGMTDYVYAVAVSRDESIVAAGGEDGVLRIWNGQNGQSLMNFDPPKSVGNQQAAR